MDNVTMPIGICYHPLDQQEIISIDPDLTHRGAWYTYRCDLCYQPWQSFFEYEDDEGGPEDTEEL